MDRGLRSALRHQSDNTHEAGKPRQATLWYDAGTGRVYGVGDGRPDGCIRSVKTVTVKYDGGGALPELANPESVRMTKALQKALDQVGDYRAAVRQRVLDHLDQI